MVIFVGRVKDYSASAMNQELAQVSVTALTDSQKNIFAAGAVLLRHQAKRCCCMPPANVSTSITNRATEGTRDNWSETRNGL